MEHEPTFSTLNFDVFRYTGQGKDTSRTFHLYKAYTRAPEGEAIAHETGRIYIGSVELEVVRELGPSLVREIGFKDYGDHDIHDWHIEEFWEELLLGIRERVGPLSLELIDHDFYDDSCVLLFHGDDFEPTAYIRRAGYPIAESNASSRPILTRLQALVGNDPSNTTVANALAIPAVEATGKAA